MGVLNLKRPLGEFYKKEIYWIYPNQPYKVQELKRMKQSKQTQQELIIPCMYIPQAGLI